MRIYKPRGLTKGHVLLVSLCGVFGGVYIWKPLFQEYYLQKKQSIDQAQAKEISEHTE